MNFTYYYVGTYQPSLTSDRYSFSLCSSLDILVNCANFSICGQSFSLRLRILFVSAHLYILRVVSSSYFLFYFCFDFMSLFVCWWYPSRDLLLSWFVSLDWV